MVLKLKAFFCLKSTLPEPKSIGVLVYAPPKDQLRVDTNVINTANNG
jgi:hypothetical protein